MPSDRTNQTLADYVALAISPALLVGLVGSLVFFLLEVLYPAQGEYKDRLQWILAFFVFGAVLVGRISMTQGIAGRAGLYGILLAGLTWIGMQIYVDYTDAGPVAPFSPLINLFLVGLVWWCSRRLTWDCTQIDEETDVEGEGLLQATGLEKPVPVAVAVKPADEPTGREKKEASPGFLIEWWERYQRFREERKQRRVLGVWVIYFSLAALPLFGLGEALIPADETARRQYAFWLMCAYVASGLGLLLTTCFLSVRRYLRQRRLQMPAAMTAVWLSAGGGLILVLLVIGALLPRLRPEYSLLLSSSGGSDKRTASNYAGQGGSSGKDEGRRTGDPPKDKGDPGARDKDSQATGKDKGDPGQDKDKGSGSDKDKDSAGKGPDKDKDSSDKDKGDAPSEKDKPPSNPPPKDAPPPRDKAAAAQKDSPPKSEPAKSGQSQPASNPHSSWDWSSALASVATVLKWIVFALLILAVFFFLLREGLKFLANFTDWARNLLNALRNLWANLFQGRTAEANQESGEAGEVPRTARAAPFSSFINPFRDGRAARRPIKELVRYTFAALEAWARDRNVERLPDETPLEFARRLGEEFPGLEADAHRFALLYARSVYDYEPLPGAAVDVVRLFWKRLETAAEQPLSI